MKPPSTELLLRVNGIQAAFGAEFGQDSPRANEVRAADPYLQANTSFSLVQCRGREIIRHTLIDLGLGVVPSLLEFETTHGVHVVHEAFISHPHFDHFANFDWLAMSTSRNGRPGQPRPLPVYASPECWEAGPARVFRHRIDMAEFRPIQPGATVTLGDLTITPFHVEHGPSAPGALGFVAWHGERKIVLTCDFHSVPGEDDPLLFGADVCFLEANTWHPIPRLSHQSVLGGLGLVRKWRPKRTYLIHYSGYEDRECPDDPIHGPLDRDRFRAELDRVRGPHDVQPARHGMILGEDTPWP